MGGMEDQAQLPAAIGQGAEESDRIGSTGDSDSKAHPRLEERGVDPETGHWRSAHERMIVQLPG